MHLDKTEDPQTQRWNDNPEKWSISLITKFHINGYFRIPVKSNWKRFNKKAVDTNTFYCHFMITFIPLPSLQVNLLQGTSE